MKKLLFIAGLLTVAGLPLWSRAGAASGDVPPVSEPESKPAVSASEISGLYTELADLFTREKYEEGLAVAKKLLAILPDRPESYYNAACALSRLNRLDDSLEMLKKAIDKGYPSVRKMARDPDLKAVAATKNFTGLAARLGQAQRSITEKSLDSLKQQYGEDGECLAEIDHARRLIYVTSIDKIVLEELKAELGARADATWKDIFANRPERYITIVVPKRWDRIEMLGFYNPKTYSLASRYIGRDLRHELTHALHYADMEALNQQHPIWIVEGFGTLLETSNIVDGSIRPAHSRRHNDLVKYIQSGKSPSLGEFIKLGKDKYMEDDGVMHYAMSRYVLMYLYDKGKLRQWYEAYTAGFDKDATGKAALETVLGAPIAEIDKHWRQWAQSLPKYRVTPAPEAPFLGVMVAADVIGPRVTRVFPNTGASRAGIEEGDLIVRIDNERVTERDDIPRISNSHKVGDTVIVEFRRGNDVKKVKVTMDTTAFAGGTGPTSRPQSSPAGMTP